MENETAFSTAIRGSVKRYATRYICARVGAVGFNAAWCWEVLYRSSSGATLGNHRSLLRLRVASSCVLLWSLRCCRGVVLQRSEARGPS
jgi:hypothetical protein